MAESTSNIFLVKGLTVPRSLKRKEKNATFPDPCSTSWKDIATLFPKNKS